MKGKHYVESKECSTKSLVYDTLDRQVKVSTNVHSLLKSVPTLRTLDGFRSLFESSLEV